MKVLIGSSESVISLNQDYQIKLELSNKNILYSDEIINNIIDESKQFQIERANCNNYLLYGKVESLIDDSLSFFDNIVNDINYEVILGYPSQYEVLDEFKNNILNITGNSISIKLNNIFFKDDIILLYKNKDNFYISKIIDVINSGQTIISLDNINSGVTNIDYFLIPSMANYKRYYSPLLTNNYNKYYNSSYSINIFNSQIYQFNTYKNINISGLTDSLGLPISQLCFIYNKTGITQFYKNNTITDINNQIIDIVSIDLNNIVISQIDYIQSSFINEDILYYYKSFDIFNFKYYSNNLTNTYIDNTFDYPSYAFLFNDGNVVYKNLLDVGYFEEGSNGIDYPFINNINYLYNDFKFIIRRIIPIYSGNTTNIIISGSTYNNTLINSDTGDNRLC